MGSTSLIPPEVYQQYLGISTRVLSRVGLIRSDKPWAFFAVAGYKHGAPKWILFETPRSEPTVRLDQVCAVLRQKLSVEVENLPMDTTASHWLECFLSELGKAEPRLLPKKKQRALEQMHDVLGHYISSARKSGDLETAARWHALQKAATPNSNDVSPDLETVAEHWLDLIRPLWFTKLANRRKRRRPLLLKDLRNDLIKNPLRTYP